MRKVALGVLFELEDGLLVTETLTVVLLAEVTNGCLPPLFIIFGLPPVGLPFT